MSRFDHPIFRLDRDTSGVVVVTIDDPGQPVNAMNERFLDQFSVLVDHLIDEKDSITGVVITSAKKTFCAGGDLVKLLHTEATDAAESAASLESFHADTRRLEKLGRPIAAALTGSALGGGYEIALACHYRVALDDSAFRIGLPEVTFGLLPGGGGLVRSVRLLGLRPALNHLLLDGNSHGATAALALGMVDEVGASVPDVVSAARHWVLNHPDATQPWDRRGFEIPNGDDEASIPLSMLPAALRKQNKGPLSTASRNIIAAAFEGTQVDIDNALKIEARYFAELACGQVSSNLIQSRFFDRQSIKRGLNRPEGFAARTASKAVVLGAGMMGAGIAHVCAVAGIEVVLKDVSIERAQAGKEYSARVLAKSVDRGRMTPAARDAVLARITPSADPADAQGADLVVEAVFEDPDLKQRVIAEILPYLSAETVIASNTSTLPITALEQNLPDPSNFIGTHFFSPVDKMALLEIVVGDKTSDSTLARTLDIAKQIGKTPIVVNDARGFFTSRVITAFLDEGVAMIGEGIAPASIEQAATQVGYPVGPLALVDEVSLTLSRTIRRETVRAREESGLNVEVHPAAAVIDRMIDEFGRGGRAYGAGFYNYPDGRKSGLWAGLVAGFESSATDISLLELQERMLFAEAIEAWKCLDENVLRSSTEGNIGSLLGIGFPAWTGGVINYVGQYEGGTAGFVERSEELARKYGARFNPPQSMIDRAGESNEAK
ncbi:3-hydroxyacyl-CoA dehydrogenase NAD-binding domain-containing protein [Rhodococcus qingshengii]|uniref:3-hydroxyacyl-CoA dehydrogenase NAD-binding domain-containing protein n=1 Tax=Rhodococcus qingshengii TaxID=334542 RepID=UPI00237CBE21|nr:3-hydroxyacyl-CoA dehydrogenase NAD-binding domain-containing protein [Rhodococcus qingshengii]WCT05771.1 3-hydroxyacyl-CoA dehydrogenase NAD-binding domain-containing protein [Rhodococcus qingshengii]